MADKKEEEAGLDEDMESSLIKLIAKDGRSFEVSVKSATISDLVKTTLESEKDATEVNLPGVDGATLERVVEYMNHHKGTEAPLVEKPLRSAEMKAVCKDAWDAEFIDRVGENRADLYALILAANFCDISGLLHLGAAKVASLIKGQPLDQIKTILNPEQAAKA